MVYSGIYLLPKSNSSSTIKSEQNSSNLNNTNTTNNVSNHLKVSKKLSSTGSTNRSSESSRFNETNSNVTIKSDINKFNKNPKLAPEILFLIKEHAKTLELINHISKKLQEIEIKVDDISQRLSRENSLSSDHFNKNTNKRDDQRPKNTNQLKSNDSPHQKELNQQTRLPYSPYKDVEHHLSNNLSNTATNIPNNQILSDDSGGEYGNKTNTKTVSDDDELLSILDKITKCSHHILQTQQAYQQQGTAIYNSISKPYAYNGLVSNSSQFNNQLMQSSAHLQQQQQQQLNANNHQITNPNINNANLQSRQFQDYYNTQSLYPQMNPYLINAKSQIKTANQPNIQQQNIVNLKYPTQQTTSLNELLFEPNVERFLSNLDQLVCNDDSNLGAILGTGNQQTMNNTHLINPNLPVVPNVLQNTQPQFIQASPQTSTPISSQTVLASSNNLRNGIQNGFMNPNYNILQSSASNQQMQPFLNNNVSLHNTSPNNNNNLQSQQYLNWQRAKELLEKKEKERINNQLKEADEWLGMVDHCINRNKYQSSKNKQLNNTKERDKKDLKTFDE